MTAPADPGALSERERFEAWARVHANEPDPIWRAWQAAAAHPPREAVADGIASQRAEFDALRALSKRFDALPAIVDDDYPEGRYYYESAIRTFLAACKANGRSL